MVEGGIMPTYTGSYDVFKLKMKTIIDALLELSEYGELCPDTIKSLQEMRHHRAFKKVKQKQETGNEN